jgi:hypothetical protein
MTPAEPAPTLTVSDLPLFLAQRQVRKGQC